MKAEKLTKKLISSIAAVFSKKNNIFETDKGNNEKKSTENNELDPALLKTESATECDESAIIEICAEEKRKETQINSQAIDEEQIDEQTEEDSFFMPCDYANSTTEVNEFKECEDCRVDSYVYNQFADKIKSNSDITKRIRMFAALTYEIKHNIRNPLMHADTPENITEKKVHDMLNTYLEMGRALELDKNRENMTCLKSLRPYHMTPEELVARYNKKC